MNNNKNKVAGSEVFGEAAGELGERKFRTVVLHDCGGSLTAQLFASRKDQVRCSKLDDYFPTKVVAVNFEELIEGEDWLVRAVKAGRRRKVEVIFGGAMAIQKVLELTKGEKVSFITDGPVRCVEFVDSDSAVVFNAPALDIIAVAAVAK